MVHDDKGFRFKVWERDGDLDEWRLLAYLTIGGPAGTGLALHPTETLAAVSMKGGGVRLLEFGPRPGKSQMAEVVAEWTRAEDWKDDPLMAWTKAGLVLWSPLTGVRTVDPRTGALQQE